jgi:hypothetical protein
MFFRRSGGLAAALFLCSGLHAGCSSKTYSDVNLGSDLGKGWRPEMTDAATDSPAAEAAGSGGASGSGGAAGDDGGAGGMSADAEDSADSGADALDNG